MYVSNDRRPRRLVSLAIVAIVALMLPQVVLAAPLAPPEARPGVVRQADDETPAEYTDYVPISDAAGLINLEVPVEWGDVVEDEWTNEDGDVIGVRLTAAPDLQAFYDEWGVPGVVISYSEVLPGEMSEEELLDTVDYSEACTDMGRETLPEGELIGVFQGWEECGDSASRALVAAMLPADSPDYYVLMEIYLASDADDAAMDRIIDTLLVGGGGSDSAGSLFDLVDTSDLAYTYVEVTDPAVVALLPEEYGDTSSALWENSDGEPLGYTYTAAPDIAEFNDTWTTPGVIVKSAIDLTESLDVDEMLKDESLEEECTYDDRYTETHEINGRVYDVAYDRYAQCGDSDSTYIVLIAQTDPPAQLLLADFLVAEEADEEAFGVLLQTFDVDPELAAGDGGEDGTDAFTSITDETDTITLRVPASWTEVESRDWDLGDGPVGVVLTAAPDLVGFDETWDVPGVFVGVSEEVANDFAPTDVLDVFEFSDDCTYDDRYEYATDALEGAYDIWLDCGDVEGDTFVVFSAVPAGEDAPIILLYMNLPTEEDTAIFSDVLDSLAIAGAVEEAAVSEEEALLEAPLAVVQVDRLNVRSGPGTGFNRVSVVTRDTALVVDGQIDDCTWLLVTTPDGVEGWVSGSSNFVTLDARCSEIPEVEAPEEDEAPAAAPAAADAPAGNNDAGSAPASSGNANQGCYIFVNGYGVELNFTFTDSGGKGTTFAVPKDGSIEKCLAPGKYTYTLDAPPPWNSVNGEFSVEAGDYVQYDLYP